MSWETPVTDHSELSLFTYDDMNRIAGNINYLQHALDAPEETVLALDTTPTSGTFGHLLSQIPAGSHIRFELQDGVGKIIETSPGYVIDSVDLIETTAERDTYEVTFTNSQTETFYVQHGLSLVVMVLKADYTEEDYLTEQEWREVIGSTVSLCNKYGVFYNQAPTMTLDADNINNIENLLLQCYDRLMLWQKQATTNVYVQNQYDRYVGVPSNNYIRGYNY